MLKNVFQITQCMYIKKVNDKILQVSCYNTTNEKLLTIMKLLSCTGFLFVLDLEFQIDCLEFI
jgi:hypothetical protein